MILELSRLTSLLQMRMICSFREGGMYFKCKLFVDIFGLKGYISTVTLEIYLLFYRLFFDFTAYNNLFYYFIMIKQHFRYAFTLEMHPLILGFLKKWVTVETHLSVFVMNHDNFFKNTIDSVFDNILNCIFALFLHLKLISYI